MKQHVFPMIGALPITEIDTPDVVQVVEEVGERGAVETAKRVNQLSDIVNLAVVRGAPAKQG